MNLYVFIAMIFIGASLLAGSLIIVSAMVSSRATARLRDKYPAIYEDEQWERSADEGEQTQQNRSNHLSHMVPH